jgi:hypothetical protein
VPQIGFMTFGLAAVSPCMYFCMVAANGVATILHQGIPFPVVPVAHRPDTKGWQSAIWEASLAVKIMRKISPASFIEKPLASTFLLLPRRSFEIRETSKY